MTDQQPPGKESKRWLIWLALGVLLALIGPTYLYNWQFDPDRQAPTEESVPQESPTPAPPTPE